MKHTLKFFTPTVILFFLLVASAFSQKAEEIVRKMDKNMRGETIIVDMEMEIIRPRFKRTIGIKSWGKGQDYALILITAPARDKGTTYLKRKKEIWNWVPSIERTIKLPPSMMSQSWMGSDFTNDDLVKESSILDDYNHHLLREEKIRDIDCYLIEMRPKPDAAVVFDKVLLWVSKGSFLEIKAENYDEYGDLVSTINSYDIKKMDDREIPTRMEMIPADKQGNKTILVYKNMQFNRPMEDSFFSVQKMKDLR